MEGKRVLIVDDEPDIVEVIRFCLERENIQCLEAYDGEAALRQAKAERPDLILLDVITPKMNGYKVSRLLKFDGAYKNIPIIMLSARAQQEDIELGRKTGADEYVTKPFDLESLIALVKSYVGAAA